MKTEIVSTPLGSQIEISSEEWDTAYNGSRTAVDRSAEQVRQELVTLSVAAEDRASNLAGINSVILMLGLLAGITIAVLVARSLIRSLRVLRTSALDVAERRLPQAVENMRSGATPDVTVDPVPLTGRDEVVQVARAFDAVHGQAVRLAADQAALQSNVSAMFVNLSRRSQALVERQLQLIEQLESNEQDPDQLSNLFQLDHLATRMRRNSENLLVLAGTDVAKRNVASVPMVDVLRAAVSEVEQYQRIVVQSPPTATIAGRAASDLVHLLAELLDNATNFSPPDSQVVMSTTRTSDGSIVVEIVDRGVSMSDQELADANQRLGGPSTVDVSAARRMGLFVVGRLATRHGVGVRLSTSSTETGSGLTASVTVPVPPDPVGRARRRQPARRRLARCRRAGRSGRSAAPGGRQRPRPLRSAPAGGGRGRCTRCAGGRRAVRRARGRERRAEGPAHPTARLHLATRRAAADAGRPGSRRAARRRTGRRWVRGGPGRRRPGPPRPGSGPTQRGPAEEGCRGRHAAGRRVRRHGAGPARFPPQRDASRGGGSLRRPERRRSRAAPGQVCRARVGSAGAEPARRRERRRTRARHGRRSGGGRRGARRDAPGT